MMAGLDLGNLGAIAAAFVVVASSPGPANLATASVALTQGQRTALIFAAGLSLGLAFWGVLAALGLGAVLRASETALVVLKLAGGTYLLWLAWQTGRSALKGGDVRAPDIPPGRWFLRGVLLNLSNPKAVFAWMAALSVGMGPEQGGAAVLTATLMCAAIGTLNACTWALLFSRPRMMTGYRRLRRGIEAGFSAFFALAGLRLLFWRGAPV
ncbi:LysE family translocator [Seohaeicola zhoushanensis]|nr:LysE family translocator [Seohaeicola zhoushanensis]